MSNGNRITVHFCCPCGMHYTATQEQRPEQSSGSSNCQDCKKPVHEWNGNFDYFDWQAEVMEPVRAYAKSAPKAAPARRIGQGFAGADIRSHEGQNRKTYQ